MSRPRSLYIGVIMALVLLLGGRLQGVHGEVGILCQGMVRSEVAVIDRAVDRHNVVLLVEPDQREWIVPRARLPTGWSEGAWLRIGWDACDHGFDDGRVDGYVDGCDGEFDAEFDESCSGWPTIVLDPEATEHARATIAAQMELLRRRSVRSAEGARERP